jgi:hypothetical protein
MNAAKLTGKCAKDVVHHTAAQAMLIVRCLRVKWVLMCVDCPLLLDSMHASGVYSSQRERPHSTTASQRLQGEMATTKTSTGSSQMHGLQGCSRCHVLTA